MSEVRKMQRLPKACSGGLRESGDHSADECRGGWNRYIPGMRDRKGLAIGADDYITKPFNPLEAVARVKTQPRRYTRYNSLAARRPEREGEIDIRGLRINRETHKSGI